MSRPLRTQVIGIVNRPLRIQAHAPGDHREIEIGVFQLGADAGAVDAAVVTRRHALDVHDFLMTGAVVVHHREDGDTSQCARVTLSLVVVVMMVVVEPIAVTSTFMIPAEVML